MHHEVLLRVDAGGGGRFRHIAGREAVVGQLAIFHMMATASTSDHMLVGRDPGLLNRIDERVVSVIRFSINGGLTLGIDTLSDPARLNGVVESDVTQ